ncbi:MAG: disulfide bond formation protein B [Candidatus Woesearchaeota archaeon]
MIVPTVKHALAILTIVGIAGILFFVLSFPFRKTKAVQKIKNFFAQRATTFSFIVALIATLGSLFFSEIAGYEPCKLCWFQRIFMYPMAIILLIALIRNLNARPYALPLTIIGIPIAAYHYGLQVYAKAVPGFSDACSATGVSCVSANFTYGFITIPLMALVAFILITILMLIRK